MKKTAAYLLVLLLLLAAGCAARPDPVKASDPPAEKTVGPGETNVTSTPAAQTQAPSTTSSENPEDPSSPEAMTTDALGAQFMSAVLSDLDGNDTSLGDLISANQVTLINIWGTFCGPCIQEMPDLGELASTYADRGFGIVGLTCDILDGRGNVQDAVVEDARQIIDSAGVEYPILVLSSELAQATDLMYVPTTYLADASGIILEGPIIGSMSASDWQTLIEKHLAG